MYNRSCHPTLRYELHKRRCAITRPLNQRLQQLEIMWLNNVLLLAFGFTAFGQYTGLCSSAACGVDGKPCPRGYLCVPYPNFDPAQREGCACSHG